MMEHKGFTLLTSKIAKAKTATQLSIIIFILVFLGFKGIPVHWISVVLTYIKEFDLIYYLTLAVTIFTVYTGITYLYDNRTTIRQLFS